MTDLPPGVDPMVVWWQHHLPPGVILVSAPDDPVVVWWQHHYAGLVAKARHGAPTALAATFRWARAEVEYGVAHGTEPEVGVPAH